MSPLTLALQITALGMGLVFAALILLWGLMALVVRFTTDRTPAAAESAPLVAAAPEPMPDARRDRRRRAAAAAAIAAAVAAELAQAGQPPPTAAVSPWQSVMRSRQLKQRGSIRN